MKVAVRYLAILLVAVGLLIVGNLWFWPVQILAVVVFVAIPVVGFVQYTRVPGDGEFSLVRGSRHTDAKDAFPLSGDGFVVGSSAGVHPAEILDQSDPGLP